MKVNLSHNELAMWIVCEAIGGQDELIDKMQVDEDGMRDIIFSVGGVELDFNNVINRMSVIFNEEVGKRAQEMLLNKYDDLIGDIDDIKERIEAQQQRFKYDWEDRR